MGSLAKSTGGLLGTSGGPGAPAMDNSALYSLQNEADLRNNDSTQSGLARMISGQESSGDWLGRHPANENGLSNIIAENPIMGSRLATSEVQNNPMLSSLFGPKGLMQNEANSLNNQVNQGWSLQPEDQTMYGQAAGNIARQYGQTGNELANNLAARGLSSSGAAGAAFSGLAGNQNEQLAKAQTQIMQQRFQNTMQQMQQMNQLAQTGAGAINQQAGRQLQGVQSQRGGLAQTAGLQQGANTQALQGAEFAQENAPMNFMDMASGGLAAGVGAFGKNSGQKAGAGLFGGSSPAAAGGGAGGGGSSAALMAAG